jgi:hypothetical protein
MTDTWHSPFKNKTQIAACLIGSRACSLYKQGLGGEDRQRYEQHIIIAQQIFSDHFLRHNASSAYLDIANFHPAKVMRTTVIRDLSSNPIKHR